MLFKWTTPWSIHVSFKKSVEYQLQVTARPKCSPPLFSESQSKECQISDTMLMFFIKHMAPICSEN